MQPPYFLRRGFEGNKAAALEAIYRNNSPFFLFFIGESNRSSLVFQKHLKDDLSLSLIHLQNHKDLEKQSNLQPSPTSFIASKVTSQPGTGGGGGGGEGGLPYLT